MSAIFRVTLDNIAGLWPQVEPLVAQGLRGAPTHDAEDVRKMLYTGSCQLWVQCDIPVVEAAVISEFVAYPKGVWFRVWIAAAKPDPGMDTDEFLEKLTSFARQNNCAGFEAIGRHGWARRIKEAKIEGLLMRVTFQ